MPAGLKHLAFQAMESQWFVRALKAARGRPACAAIVMHRFADERSPWVGHSPERLRTVLSTLKASGVEFVSLEQAISYCTDESSAKPELAVTFTVDDGYADFAELALPVFQEFDCDVSLYVVPSVVDGREWFWWDKLDWIARNTRTSELQIELDGRPFVGRWTSAFERHLVVSALAERLKKITSEQMLDAIDRLSRQHDVALPASAPELYKTLGWDQLREIEATGKVRIGAHTMTHPVLSRCKDAKAEWEITESLTRVSRELRAPLSVFCYPNGSVEDHGPREWEILRRVGVSHSLTTVGGLLTSSLGSGATDPHWMHRIPRVGYEDQAGRIIREFVN